MKQSVYIRRAEARARTFRKTKAASDEFWRKWRGIEKAPK